MDTQTTSPEVAISPESEPITPNGVEATPIAEVTPSSPVASQPVDDVVVSDAPIAVEPEKIETPLAEEVEDLSSPDVAKADDDWTDQVRDVIRADEGLPFKEDADAEALNQKYMKKRFDVDVDAPIEEK